MAENIKIGFFLSDPAIAEPGETVELAGELQNLTNQLQVYQIQYYRHDTGEQIYLRTGPLDPNETLLLPRTSLTMPNHQVDLTATCFWWNQDLGEWRFADDRRHTITVAAAGAEFDLRSLNVNLGGTVGDTGRRIEAEVVAENVGDERGAVVVAFDINGGDTRTDREFISPGDTGILRQFWTRLPGSYEICAEIE